MRPKSRSFAAARAAGAMLWRRPLAPLVLGLLVLGWELVPGELAAPLVRRLLRDAWSGEPLLPRALALAVVALTWNALLSPLLGFGLTLVEAAPAQAVPRAVAQLAGLGSIGLAAGLAAGASQACVLAALFAVGRRSWLGGGPLGGAILWASATAPALLLGALAGGGALLATARISTGDLPGRTPVEGLRALGRAVADLLSEPVRAGNAFAALLLMTVPFSLGAVFLGMAGVLIQPPAAAGALRVGSALAGAAVLLWVALGLRIALRGEVESTPIVPDRAQ